MIKNVLVCKKPNISWIHSINIDNSINANNFNFDYLDTLNKLRSSNLKIIELRDIADKISDGPFGSQLKVEEYKEQGFPVYRVKNIIDTQILDDDIVYIDAKKQQELKRSEVLPGDVLITKAGRIGSAAVVPSKLGNGNITSHLVLVRLKKTINNYYLVAYLECKYGKVITSRESYKSTRPELTKAEIENVIIPIPSYEIQKYIGDKIRKAEELREEAKRLKKEAEEILNRELNLNKLEESLKSSINSKHNWITSMDINDRIDSYYYKRRYILVNQHLNDYECIQIRDIASVDYGYMPTEDYADENNGVPLIRVTNMIGNLLLDLSDLKYISKSINIPDDKYVDDGDILVVQCGNTTGKIALMTKEVENYLYPSFCLRIKLRNKSINNKYLALLMEMSIIQEQIWQSASYSSVRPNTTKPAIENIRIPLIEKQKQEDVGVLVEKYIDNIYQSKQLIQEAKQDVEDLIEGNFDMSKVKANS